METNFRRNFGLVLAAVFIGFLIWSSIAFQNIFVRIVPYFEHLVQAHAFLSVFVFIALGIISTMFSSFSSLPLVPIAIIVWGNAFTALLLCIGWLLGDILSYVVGYKAGNPILRRFLPYDDIQFYLKKIPPNAEFKMILLFILSMPAEIPGYTIGALRYKFSKYLIAQLLNEIFYSALVAYAAGALVGGKPIYFFGIFFFGAILFGYCFYLFRKIMRR